MLKKGERGGANNNCYPNNELFVYLSFIIDM